MSEDDAGSTRAGTPTAGRSRSGDGRSVAGEPDDGTERAGSGDREARQVPDDDEGRVGRVASWLLVEGNRLVVAGGVTAAVLLSILAVLGVYGPAALAPNSPVNFLFSALLTGDLTLVTVVLSINQVVLSRELADPGTFRRRIGDGIDFRRDVEATADEGVSPSAPAAFLRYLHDALGEEAAALDAATGGVDDEECRSRLRSLAGSVARDVRRVNETLEDGDRVFAVVSATVATNHADQLQEITVLRHRQADALTGDVRDTLSTIEDLLLDVDVARQYFKTVYVQKELAYLSRVLLYVGLPAVLGCGLAIVLYNAAGSAGVSVGVLAPFATAAFVAGFAPLAVLVAFILRLAWIAQRSATTAPFGSAAPYRP